MRTAQRGFLLIASLMVIAGATITVTAGVARSASELLASAQTIRNQEALYLAEAAIDLAITEYTVGGQDGTTGNFSYTGAGQDGWTNPTGTGACNGIVPTDCYKTVTVSPGKTYTAIISNYSSATPRVTATGAVGIAMATTVNISANLSVPRGSVFEHIMVGAEIDIHDQVKIGQLGAEAPLYFKKAVYAEDRSPGEIEVWVSEIRFRDTSGVVCQECADPGVFYGSPPIIKGVPALPAERTTVDLNPYYERAIQDCMNTSPYPSQAACIAGTAGYHHITSATTLSGTKKGVIYIEKGVNVTLASSFKLDGTIVHESGSACKGNALSPSDVGRPGEEEGVIQQVQWLHKHLHAFLPKGRGTVG